MLKLTKTKTSRHSKAASEFGASNFIPYIHHWNHKTIITKDETLMRFIKINGFSFETADDSDLDIKKQLRNTLFKGLASGGTSLYFHIIRRRHSIFKDTNVDEILQRKAITFPDFVEQAWIKKQMGQDAFINELYVTVINRPDVAGAAMVEHIINKFQQKASKTNWEVQMRERHEHLEEISTRVVATLADYNAKELSLVETDDGNYSEILEFLGKIVNCNVPSRYLPTYGDISKILCNQRLYFGSKSIESSGAHGSRYAGIISVKEYAPNTHAGILDSFLQMPFEMIITQSFSFANRQVAINSMQLQQNRMMQAEDKAISQVAEITEALDMAMSGKIGFGLHHMTIMCTESTPKKLEYALSQAVVELSNTGIIPVRERVNLESTFWGQLPGNGDFIVRKATINTLNLAGFNSMHNYPVGKAKGNHWGDAVTVLNTTSGTPYFFNFHLRDVGHTTIIGPTGAGKTVLMNFLCAQSQKFNCRMFFFDKDRGAEIFIRAISGIYTVIDPGQRCGFNPLKLENNSENRTFLLEWLKVLVTTNQEKLTSEDIKTLSLAVTGNFRLKKEDRILKNVVPFLGIETEGSLASRMSMWYGNGSHASVFDNDTDTMDFTKASAFGFEMAQILKDPIAINPVLLYLFHRINISLDGTPTMLVLDEAWALIDNPVFAPKIKDWLKVLRKLNAMVIFATQSVEDASKSAISDTLIQQTATQIFLPNLKATDVYKTKFMLSQREYELIKTTDPSSRFFLIKQGLDAVVARLDLKGMTDIINVLSGRSDSVLMLAELMRELGQNPKDWLPTFFERCRNL